MNTFVIRRAKVSDLGIVISLIDQAARWLRTMDTDQWRHPWPTRAGRVRRIAEDLKLGKTLIAWDNVTPAATITIEYGRNQNLPELWRPDDDGPAVSVHRVVVNRRYAGIRLGKALLEWAGREAAHYGMEWVRIDVWRTNERLQGYYEDQNFKFVRYHDDKSYPSGALFQRRISDAAEVSRIALVMDTDTGPPPSPAHHHTGSPRPLVASCAQAPRSWELPGPLRATVPATERALR